MPKRTAIQSETFTLQELARRLGISLTVAYELARCDDLPVPIIRVGRRCLFSERAYEALMNGQHAPNADDAA